MSVLDDTAIFIAVIQQGSFSHAAKHLGFSKGLISRRIALLEANLGVTLIKRTTRQIQLTPEGILFWQHAERIQQELDSAICSIQSSAKKPKGKIRISAAPYFGRHYLTPILMKFLINFNEIKIDLILDDQQLDPFKSRIDLIIRSAGILQNSKPVDSNLQMKTLITDKIGLYVSPTYIAKNGSPENPNELSMHTTIRYADSKTLSEEETWHYTYNDKINSVTINPTFNVNDIGSALTASIAGFGIGRFNSLVVKDALEQKQLIPILKNYDWGLYSLYGLYPQQKALPERTRLLLDFIYAHTKNLLVPL